MDGALDRIAVYQLALEVNRLACQDALVMKREPLLFEHAAQLARAVASVAANIAEGYTRYSRRERLRFYGYALGSAEEARTWYLTSQPLIRLEGLPERIRLLVRIRQLLLAMLRNERQAIGGA